MRRSRVRLLSSAPLQSLDSQGLSPLSHYQALTPLHLRPESHRYRRRCSRSRAAARGYVPPAWARVDALGLASARNESDTPGPWRSEEHTSELQSLMRISYAVFCLKKK